MADVVLSLQNNFYPDQDPAIMTVDENGMLFVSQGTDPSGRKRAGDVIVGDEVIHARGTFTVVAPA